MSQPTTDLPKLDNKKTKNAIVGVFEKYQIFKNTIIEQREATITASYQDRPSGPTNVTSDSTANVAIFNVFEPEHRRQFCENVELAVSYLYPKYREIIELKYLGDDMPTDYAVYNFKMDHPISKDTYAKLRRKAFQNLAYSFHAFGIINIQSLIDTKRANIRTSSFE
ncbi:ArpU family phage packaging/lysis transcriptional regulator [Paenibacillus ottowii]|uniref:Transcriptional regulator n=1 Tax=Paenibacillus ottowii TaxID=2315729 RepID=A0ABY3BDZ3_9BACL|nr:ArpU family phage packaging/lysis transcriptional regulator [Paenibacillus ottowii]TQS01408.1 transcriptional regulator [Paenibacillus ottowii]TQS01463.1 transcriptional regulator [Paenibacillus ottowii]